MCNENNKLLITLGMYEEAQIGRKMKEWDGNDINQSEYSPRNVKDIIEEYSRLLEQMPYPLCAIESDSKYAAIGSVMQRKFNNHMRVSSGLNIEIKDGLYIKIINTRWRYISKIEFGYDTDRNNWVGCKQFKWWKENPENKKGYYEEFMPNIAASGNETEYEINMALEKVLAFERRCEKQEFLPNRITSAMFGCEYYYDWYSETKQSGVKSKIIVKGNEFTVTDDNGVYEVDNYDIYKKEIGKRARKIDIGNLFGMHTLFNVLSGIRKAEQSCYLPFYTGVLINNIIIVEVRGRIYCIDAHKANRKQLIASDAKLWKVTDRDIYFEIREEIKKKKKNTQVRQGIYAMSIKNRKLRICKVKYE